MSAFLSPIEPAGQDISPASHVPLPWQSRVQIPELRVPISLQMPHGPLSKHAAPLPCTKHNHLAPRSFTRYQPLISGCHVWKTLLSYSHDTSPPQRSAVCRGHALIHMIPVPHQRLPCLEDTALLFARYQPHISGCRVWKTLLFYSHDTSLTSAAAVCRGLRSLTQKCKEAREEPASCLKLFKFV